MSFSLEHKTLRSGKTYDLKSRLEMSTHKNQSTAASKTNAVERVNEAGVEFSLDLIEERIKANLEPFNAQISALRQMMDKLIQDNSATAYPTPSASDRRFPSPDLQSQTIPELPKLCR